MDIDFNRAELDLSVKKHLTESFQKSADSIGKLEILGRLGELYLLENDAEAAKKIITEALELSFEYVKQMGRKITEYFVARSVFAELLGKKAMLQQFQGEYLSAIETYKEALSFKTEATSDKYAPANWAC